jgi:hypothetical protein
VAVAPVNSRERHHCLIAPALMRPLRPASSLDRGNQAPHIHGQQQRRQDDHRRKVRDAAVDQKGDVAADRKDAKCQHVLHVKGDEHQRGGYVACEINRLHRSPPRWLNTWSRKDLAAKVRMPG